MARTNNSDDFSHDMTKREAAAVQAMQGLLASGAFDPEKQMAHVAFMATAAADALFDELAKE